MNLGPNQTAWIESLEREDFKQGFQELQSERGVCCLGVACKIARRSGVEVSVGWGDRLLGTTLITQFEVKSWIALRNSTGVPGGNDPATIAEWIEQNFDVQIKDHNQSGVVALVNLNDTYLTHPQIAAVLRQFPDAYFSESK